MIDLLLTNEYALIYGNEGEGGQFTHGTPESHKHTFEHIIIGLKGVFSVSVGEQSTKQIISCAGIMIDSNIPHTLTIDSDNLIYLVDKTTSIASQLSKIYFQDAAYYIMPDPLIAAIRRAWAVHLDEKTDMQKASQHILELCQINPAVIGRIDERIEQALEIIECSEGIYEGFVGDLANKTGLSKSRFCHLFKEQTGMSISSYLLCSKVSKAYQYNFSGMSMTESAVRAGFNSLSHFSETHKKMFGFALSNYKPSVNIQFR